MANATAAPAVTRQPLDEVMLAMDVVDTLRHRQHIVDKELDAEGREVALVSRLKDIYAAQGIDVPDRILREGVKALEEKRFTYTPPSPSLSVSLAKLYITRDRWMRPALIGLAALVASIGVYQVGVAGPQAARAAAIERELTTALPDQIAQYKERIDAIAEEPRAQELAAAFVLSGTQAVANDDVTEARRARDNLSMLADDLAAQYRVTIVSRPGEMSGVFRIPDDVPGARNHYLIVEAIDPSGRALPVTISSEEDQRTRRVTKWGQRVGEDVFNAVSADKRDDQIIQNAVIGEKPVGYLTPNYSIPVESGAILEW